jgi:hypothetical protein
VERQQELEDVAARLSSSMDEVEATIAENATAFNAMAEQLEQTKAVASAPSSEPAPPSPAPSPAEGDEEDAPLRARSVRRRFGSELTLDD